HRGRARALAFSPNGKLLASGSEDTTALLWDLTGELRRRARPQAPAAKEAARLWADLAREDAARAYRVVQDLAAAPTVTIPYLRTRLRPAPSADAAQMARLLRGLGSKDAAVREQARSELERLGEAA